MRVVRAIGALSALAALLVGVPWILARFGNATELLTLDWASALGGIQGGRLMLALLSTAGWVAWLVLAATTLLEAVAVASRYRVTVTLPGTGWLRPVVSTLLLAAVGAPGGLLAQAAQPHDAGPLLSPPGPAQTAASPAPVPPAPATSAPAKPAPDAPAVTTTRPTAPPSATRTYVVQAGDELWTLAERELGSGDRWRRIVELNPELGDSGRLTPGATVRLPATKGAPAAPSPTVETELRVVVREGESLWRIAERELGDAERWPEIFALNRDQVADPNQIDIGWVLRIPAPPPSAERREARPAAPAVNHDAPHDDEASPTSAPVARETVPPTPTPAPDSRETTPPTPAPVSRSTAPPTPAPASTQADPMVLAAPLGAALAGAILLSVSTRRRAQLLGRAVGRRLIPTSPQVTHFWTALARRAEEQDDAGPDDPAPTTLVLGWRDDDVPVTVDLEAARATLLHGSRAEEALAAALTSLACAPWSEGVDVIVVGAPEWVEALDDPRFSREPDAASGLSRMSRLAAERRLALRGSHLAASRADVETADAWRPAVFVFTRALTPAQLDAVADGLALGETGVSVLAHSGSRRAPRRAHSTRGGGDG